MHKIYNDNKKQDEYFQEAMKKYLSFVERQILVYLRGWNERHDVLTREQLGNIFHEPEERIKQIEEGAITKLEKSGDKKVLERLVA